MPRTYRYVNDHGDIFRMTETRFRHYLLAGTMKLPDAADYGVCIGSAVTVNDFTSTEFADLYNYEARKADKAARASRKKA